MDVNMDQVNNVPNDFYGDNDENVNAVTNNNEDIRMNKMIFTPMPFALSNFEDPIIHNIVATANFGCKFDLSKINIRVRNSEYNPKRFRAVIMRLYDPRTTAMVFSSGKIVCTGAKSERLACLAARKYQRIIQKLGYEVSFTEFKIQNIVSTVDVKFPIRLDKLALVHSQFCTYDPDFFPALIYRMVRPRTVLLIFVSGKIIITGAKSRNDIMETINHMTPVLYSFRKQ